MSLFQFLASDKLLKEVSNPYMVLISINEAIKRNLEVPALILKNNKIDKDEKIILACDSEEHLDKLEIKRDMYYSDEYAQEYSQKPYYAQLQWRFTKSRAAQLYDYLMDQLKKVEEIEIWSIWLDDYAPANVKKVDIKDLKLKDLSVLDCSKGYVGPQCLIITKGK